MKKILLYILAVIIVASVIVLAVVGATISGGGYKVTITGKVTYDGLGHWDIQHRSTDYEIDQSVFSSYPASWFWETDNIKVELTLWGKEKYVTSKTLGTVFALGGEKTFSLDLRHVEIGYYSAELRVYEVKGGFFGVGGTQTLRDTYSFNVDIEDMYNR